MLTIAVTGHRLLSEVIRLESGVDQALTRIAQKYPGESWRAVSSLAEGADRLVVRLMLLRNPTLELIVPLPLSLDEYRADFASQASRQEFQNLLSYAKEVIPPQVHASREEGYRQAGETMLDRSDLLIAVWNGLQAQGTGGTGEIVSLARRRKMPIAWVFFKDPTLLPEKSGSRLGKAQGELTLENF